MTVTLNPAIMKSIEQLDYAVTVGDVAAQAGLEINFAQQGLMTLAAEAGGHLQVADSGEIVFQFPKNYRTVLRNKYWRLRFKENWQKIWRVLFYIIRISFGIILVASIILMMVAIAAILIAVNSSKDSNNSNDDRGGGFFFFPTDIFWFFTPGDSYNRYENNDRTTKKKSEMNFLEAVFSFLFGDGNPNYNLEEKRWQDIGTVIRNNGGAIAAEQIAPYLDNVTALNQETEDYILPVLARFNGYPQVSPEGNIIYSFPELQVMAKQRRSSNNIATYLQEKLWRFSQAESSQIMLSVGLGGIYIILAFVLGNLFQTYVVDIALVSFVHWLYPALLAYGIGFLGIPLIRYFWIQNKNKRIESRNQQRQVRAEKVLQPPASLRQKLQYAQQFASQTVITAADITYSTDQDLLEQEANRSDKIDQEWQNRLKSGS